MKPRGVTNSADNGSEIAFISRFGGRDKPTFYQCWGIGETVAKGDGRLRSGTEGDRGVGVKSGGDEAIERPRRRPGGQTQVREDFGDHGGLFDGGNDLELAATVRTVFDVDIEHSFQ